MNLKKRESHFLDSNFTKKKKTLFVPCTWTTFEMNGLRQVYNEIIKIKWTYIIDKSRDLSSSY